MTNLVSVIIPVYNDQNGLVQSLEALSRQTYPRRSLEVIVVDNNSSPPITIPSEFSDFARLHSCSKPGAYTSRNVGIRAARGEILAFTDADCYPEKDWLKNGIAALLSGANEHIIGGEISLCLSSKPTATEYYQYLVGFMQKENIESLGFSATANLFVTRQQLDKIGLFDDELLSAGDREWCWRAQRHGFTITYAPTTVVYTKCRRSLWKAIQQARRVTGGRVNLSQRLSTHHHVNKKGIKPYRSPMNSLLWIFSHQKIKMSLKVRIAWVATTLKLIQYFELARLHLGGSAERK